MTEYEILTDDRNPNVRVRVLWDEYGFDCEPDLFTPFVKIEHSYPTEMISDYAEESNKAMSEGLANAIYRWSASPSDREWELVEKYMRAFWGVKELHTFYSDGIRGWYVGTYKGTVDEYQAWCEGEVFIIQTERRITERTLKSELDGTLISDDEIETWEETDTVGGFIGADYVIEEARAILANEIEGDN